MTFLEAVKKSNKIKEQSWPEYDYIDISNKSNKHKGTVMYWNNASFVWTEIRLSLDDIIADDWMEAK